MNKAKLTILIIDDEPLFLKSTKLLLRSKYRCLSASSGEAGVREAEASNPDLVICDVKMSAGINGFEVCDYLKSKDPSLPIILLTNFNDQECRLRGLKSGANDYLGKRVDNEELLQRVENTLVLAGKLSQPEQKINDLPASTSDSQIDEFQDATFLEKLESALRTAIDERQNHIQSELSLEQMAKRLHISPRTLQRKLDRATGQIFTEFRQSVLMSVAIELLPTAYSLSTISNVLDISSQSYFTALFKKTYGCSPSEYRKKLHE